MNSLKSLILTLISIFLFSILGHEVQASSSFVGLESQISSASNVTKIKKMQLVLREFSLYSWEIDGIFTSVEQSLLAYQKETWIIIKDDDYWAWYFGIQTLKALQEDYPDNFEEVTKEYLQMDKPSTNVRYFYITAYYSPLPGQNRYTTWTYAGDIRLNWWWKVTASWKWVSVWLLAWPRNYNFWTKIEFEWLWVWVVEDRWWAIVNAWERWHEFDRIDVWMWYGDEWLRRALKWWKRKVKWKVVPNTREISIQFDVSPVINYENLRVDAEDPKEDNVKELQELLTEVKIYTWAIDWDFSSVKDQLIKYQVDNNIISSKNEEQAWYFWEKTYAALRKSFAGDVFRNRNNELDEDVILTAELRDKLDLLNDKITLLIDNKYGKDTSRAIKFRRDIRTAIDKQTKKVRTDLRKRQLKYLKSLI